MLSKRSKGYKCSIFWSGIRCPWRYDCHGSFCCCCCCWCLLSMIQNCRVMSSQSLRDLHMSFLDDNFWKVSWGDVPGAQSLHYSFPSDPCKNLKDLSFHNILSLFLTGESYFWNKRPLNFCTALYGMLEPRWYKKYRKTAYQSIRYHLTMLIWVWNTGNRLFISHALWSLWPVGGVRGMKIRLSIFRMLIVIPSGKRLLFGHQLFISINLNWR